MPKSSKVLRPPKASKTSKALLKATKKASKKLDKNIGKLNKKITKAVRKQAKKKESVLAKRKRAIDRWANKALELNKETQNIINEFKSANIPVVENEDTIKLTDRRIREIQAKARPTDKDLEKLKEWAKPSHYDYIKIKLNLRPEEEQDDVDITVTSPNVVTLKKVRQVLARQLNKPEAIIDEQQQIINQYAKTVVDYKNQTVADLSTDEAQQKFKKRFKKTRDVAIGGNSTLINDLSYTYDCNEEGRELVELLQGIMSNATDFVRIESWYRNNYKLQDDIDKAKGNEWYSAFQDVRVTLIGFLSSDAFDNISNEYKTKLDSIVERMEMAADEDAEG